MSNAGVWIRAGRPHDYLPPILTFVAFIWGLWTCLNAKQRQRFIFTRPRPNPASGARTVALGRYSFWSAAASAVGEHRAADRASDEPNRAGGRHGCAAGAFDFLETTFAEMSMPLRDGVTYSRILIVPGACP